MKIRRLGRDITEKYIIFESYTAILQPRQNEAANNSKRDW